MTEESRGCLIALGLFALGIAMILVWGWVISLGWGWFVVPLGVIPITYWHATGLAFLASMFVGWRSSAKDSESMALVVSLAQPFWTLGFMWVIAMIMGVA